MALIVTITNICYTGFMPAKTTSIALGEKFTEYTRRQVESGEYGSTSEVIRDALRLHEERAAFRSKLLEAIDEGLASPLVDFDPRVWIDDNYPAE